GRTRALLVDPVAPEVMYAAGVSGGVWKTHNGGARWEPIADDLVNIAVTSLAMHPTDTKTIYAGTGEGYFREEQRGTGLPLRGFGIFVTRDAGATWSQLPSTANADFHWVNDLVVSTHDPSRVYAATRTGVWRSKDGGAQWTRVVATNVKGGCLDLAFRGDRDGDYLFASCGTFQRATVYRTTNAERDTAWTAVLSEPNMGRTTLAIAPSNPSIVYALSASNEAGAYHQGLLAVFRSDQNGDAGSWEARVRNTSADRASTLLLTNPLYGSLTICRSSNARDVFITMGWYCNALAVDPVDPNRVWAGGVDLFRSDDGGASWGVASYWWTSASRPSFVHADQHAIVFHPHYDANANRKMFVANDGGVYRTDNALADPATGSHAPCNTTSNLRFTPLNNNYGVTQFYHGAVFPDGRAFIAGAQDNGTVRGSIAEGTDGWRRVTGGDGGYVAIDPHEPNFVYAESQGGVLYRSSDGGERFDTATAGLSDRFAFITPLAMDPNDTKRLWYGGTKLWRTDDRAQLWSAASATLRGLVSAIAVAPGMSDRVLAGTDAGDIVRSDSATTAAGTTRWSEARPRDGFVSSLAFDPVDPNVAFATYAGFGGTHVWKSIDGGATWSPLDGTGDGALPDIPVHSLVVDPTRRERLYLGTDLGVFVSLDGGTRWAVENTGFTAAVTESLVIGRGARGPAIYAFTHGRGAWRAELTLPPSAPRRRSVR
ncbi:MAG TPA: hypothetical protein VHL59_04040, partial [Thermoanaerobaculia bacterium]|nr:hypothetical protein [Thermoanaerobaculia bacterium]